MGYSYKYALRMAKRIKKSIKLNGSKRNIKRTFIVGSLRRKEKSIGDIDILVVSNNTGHIKISSTLPIKWKRRGSKMASGKYKDIPIDIFICRPSSLACALFHHTGPASYNIRIRKYAKDRGYHLNQYKLTHHGKKIKTKTERSITHALGTTYYSPSARY